jgi:lipopolysaccharide/colanic/teichoic acid biosynthesis glycosyltransferase
VNLIAFAREPLRANREESRNRIKTAASAESQTAPARFNKYLLLIVSVVVALLFLLLFLLRFLLLFLYDRLDLGSVNFRNERLSYDWNRHLARQ